MCTLQKCEPTHINVKTYEKFATAFGGNFIEHILESTKGMHFIKKNCQLLCAFPFSRIFFLFFKVVPSIMENFQYPLWKSPTFGFAPFSVKGATQDSSLSNLMCIGIWVSYATTFGCQAGDTSKRMKQFQLSCGFDMGNVKRLNLWPEQMLVWN
jgi:hypothetical protein